MSGNGDKPKPNPGVTCPSCGLWCPSVGDLQTHIQAAHQK